MARRLRWLLSVAWLAGACGQIRIVGDDVAAPSDAGADTSVDAVSPDGQGGDGKGLDTASGCQSDEACKGIKGKTPCKDPVCDKVTGQCKLQARAVGNVCVDPFNELLACQETRCDGSGQCQTQKQADGTACGIGACGNVCKAGQCKLATPADYDDANPCTNDYCDQGKFVAHDPVTSLSVVCDDKDACTTGDACVSGVCHGAPLNCSDNFECTLDTCTKTGGCQHTPTLDVCSDGNPCTKDVCDLAVGCTAVGFEFVACDDNNVCSEADWCDKGVCKGKPSSDPACACAADSECIGKAKDSCSLKYKCDTALGVCAPKSDSVVTCDTSKDGACQKSACDPATGTCVTLPVAGTPDCNDDDACTAASVCKAGNCVGTASTDCADNNACTLDSCASDTGCAHVVTAGACDDGNPCTANDACQAGTCAGSKIPCDDGLLCTFDGCDPKTGGCQHLADAPACDDKNPCTSDTCDLQTDCQHAVDDSAACDDGNPCTGDSCKGGKCVSVVQCDCAVDADCDDKNPCTTDVCQAGKCVAKSADGGGCSPADKCQKPGSGVCTGGACVGGNAPIDCSSVGNACNAGVCDATNGTCQAVAKPAGTQCEDGNGCTEGDTCAGGTCTPGTPLACPSLGPCNNAVCQATGSTTHVCTLTGKPAGTPCDDGLFCTVGEQCDTSGACIGAPVPCESSSVCVAATCVEAIKACVNSNLDSSHVCDDGLYCTVNDACDGKGGCAGGTPRTCTGGTCVTGVCDEPTDQCLAKATPECCSTSADCDDGFACTDDSCDGKACTHSAASGCCDPTLWVNHFDAGSLEGMTLTNSSGSLALGWQPRTGPVFKSGPTALYYGDLAKNNFDFGASWGVASTPTMTLPDSMFGPGSLQFAVWFDTESGNAYDLLTVSAVFTTAGGGIATTQLWSKPQALQMGQWLTPVVSLPFALAGQTGHFEFKFNTVDSVANSGQGVYLDDISVQALCF